MGLTLRACYKQGIDGYIRLVEVLNGLIEEITETIHSSGGKTIFGSITKQGSRWLRWIMIELSHHFINGSDRMKTMYLRIDRPSPWGHGLPFR